MSQGAAYIAAGYSDTPSADANASRLITNDKIVSRIQELRQSAAEDTEVTLQWLIEQAQGVLCDARIDKSHTAAIAAIKELGILTGERVEKRDNTNRNITDLADLSKDELYAIASRERAAAKDGRSDRSDSVH